VICRVNLREIADPFNGGKKLRAQACPVVRYRRGRLVEIHFHAADSFHTPQRPLDPIAAGVALASIQEAHRSHITLLGTESVQ
jgi:hypothetical protein